MKVLCCGKTDQFYKGRGTVLCLNHGHQLDRFLGIFSIFAGYLDQGSEVILMEPFFDQYIVRFIFTGTNRRIRCLMAL